MVLVRRIGPLVFDGLTTAERDALTVEERQMVFNVDTSQFEVYINGSWRTLLDYVTSISSAQHGTINEALHPVYARLQSPETITSQWTVGSGGRITAQAGNPPVGEIVVQVKTTAGAPTHSATEGTLCFVQPDGVLHANSDGGSSWQAIGGNATIVTDYSQELSGSWQVQNLGGGNYDLFANEETYVKADLWFDDSTGELRISNTQP